MWGWGGPAGPCTPRSSRAAEEAGRERKQRRFLRCLVPRRAPRARFDVISGRADLGLPPCSPRAAPPASHPPARAKFGNGKSRRARQERQGGLVRQSLPGGHAGDTHTRVNAGTSARSRARGDTHTQTQTVPLWALPWRVHPWGVPTAAASPRLGSGFGGPLEQWVLQGVSWDRPGPAAMAGIRGTEQTRHPQEASVARRGTSRDTVPRHRVTSPCPGPPDAADNRVGCWQWVRLGRAPLTAQPRCYSGSHPCTPS